MINISREKDKEIIKQINKDKLADFIFMHLRNMWAVDGLYYLFIEEKFGKNEATEIDRKVWEVMGKIEARKIKDFFKIKGSDVKTVLNALKYSGWAMDLEDKEIIINKEKGVIRNIKCRVQNSRIKKGLSEFGCKPVRHGFLKAFAKEFNQDVHVICKVCPPDEHPDNLWCEWEFKIKAK